MLGTITLTVGQPDAVSQKEEATENIVTAQEEVAPQVNGEKMEKESPDANNISAVEETAGEEKSDDATEVGFKKIFRFVGFKFTLKKEKNEEKDPVKLLTVKDKDEEVSGTDEPAKEEAVAAEEKSTAEEKESDTEATTIEAEVTEDTTDKAEPADAPAEGTTAENTDEAVKAEGAEKEGEASQEATLTMSPLKKLFSTGLFSNLRKKTSIKKTNDEEDKEAAAVEKTQETAAEVEEQQETVEAEQQIEETPAISEEEKSEPKGESSVTVEEAKSEATPEPEATVETPAPTEAITEESKQEEEKSEGSNEEEKAPAEVTSEADLLSSQEKAKPQGSPLKKLFTGAGLKKLSTKKQKNKKEKLTESGERTSEQLQSSADSEEAPKAESGPSSPEESGEHVIAVEVTQNESSQEVDAEVTSDGEKKKEGIIAWSSFKRLVTPKKLVKRSSDSEDEATGEKPKSATLSSSESAALADKSVEEETKEEKTTEEEPKTENTEKLVSSTEEPKKKLDTSVSWEALMCMGGAKKRTRRTSDSDDEETKVEEEAAAVEPVVEEEQEAKTEDVAVTSQNTESDAEVVSSPEPVSSPPERESTWDTLKRMVMSKNKAKVEEKPEDNGNQVLSDSEGAAKEESSFSLRKFFPGLRKKKVEKQGSTEQGEEDSDTPAVVPLSEYDEQVEATQEAPTESAPVQSKGSTEDRSPSWIPATIEDAENQHDQLSDIPEEAENAATPKSADTDLADDETPDNAATSPSGLGRAGRRLSTAEVASVTPAPDAQATLVPQESTPQSATEVMESAEVCITQISPQTSVAVEDVQLNEASSKTEYEPQSETAESTTNTILQVHIREEAMAICTGLGTKEIAKVALEKPAVSLIEDMALVCDPLSTEVLVGEKPSDKEQAIPGEDEAFKAHVLQVDTTALEPFVDNSLVESVDIEAATESHEPEFEKTAVVSTDLEGSMVIQSTTLTENSPKAVIIDPITPTSETAVCTQTVEVSGPKVETKELKIETEQLVSATEENAPIKEVVQVVTEELASTVCGTTKESVTKETEPDIPVVLPTEEVPVITQTVILTSLITESDQVTTSEDMVVTKASVSETVCYQMNQATEIKEEDKVVDTVEVTTVQALEDLQQTSDAQPVAISQASIIDAVDKMSDLPESKKSTIPVPVQAVAKVEEEIAVSTETPVMTDTPVLTMCEHPAPKSPQPLHVATQLVDTLEIEVTESLDAQEDVKVSEETVVLEDVMERQVGEEEQSKDEADKEVKSQVEETKPEASSENKDSHAPVQVVLQIAQVVEEVSMEEEAVVEFDSNGPVEENTSVKAESHASENKLTTLTEESEVPSKVTEAAAAAAAVAAASEPETEKTPSGKCAEVMAQVIEVIEEAVKEIEPVSTEITTAS